MRVLILRDTLFELHNAKIDFERELKRFQVPIINKSNSFSWQIGFDISVEFRCGDGNGKYYSFVQYDFNGAKPVFSKSINFGTMISEMTIFVDVIQKEDYKNRAKVKHRFGNHASTPIGTVIDASIIDGSFTATCTLTDKAVNEPIGALSPMPKINIDDYIKDVIYNDPATIVFWKDGTKTVVKDDGDAYDPEKGLAMAFCKKVSGNKGNYYKVFKKWLPDEFYEFKAGCKVKLTKKVCGLPAGIIGIIVEQDSLKMGEEDDQLVYFFAFGKFYINGKYLKLV